MRLRCPMPVLLLLLALPIAGCSTVQSIVIVPGTGVQTLNAIGQTAQFKAIATSQQGAASPTTGDATRSVTWAVTNPSVATINSSGLATAVGAGNTAITAQSGGVIASSDLTVTIPVAPLTVKTLAIVPGAGVQTLNSIGETAQFKAIATTQVGTSSVTTADVTNSVSWGASNSSVARISSSGLATSIGIGQTAITAELGGVIASSDLTVTSAPGNAPTLTIIPGPQTAAATTAGETTQFIAIGNLSGAGATQDLTNRVTWASSDVGVATINQNGLATGIGTNTGISATATTITALATTATGSTIVGTSTLTMTPAGGTVNLPTLTIYKVGAGAAAGTVTSSPAELSCGSQASGSPATCTGYFLLGSSVIVTASPSANASFAGWSANCSESGNSVNPAVTLLAGQCVVKMSNNETVGAIFTTP